jgi:hypothetical protein
MATRRSLSLSLALALFAAPLHAQSAGGRTPVAPGTGATPGQLPPGKLVPKPGGGLFLVDPSRGGQAHALGLVEVRFGRVVDVHGLDASGAIDPAPLLRDFVVGETVQSDGSGYLLVTSPATEVAKLVVLRQPGAPEPSPGAGTFAELLRAAEDATVVVPPKSLGASLVATLPRNSALSLRFDDLLSDGASAITSLLNDVKVFVAPSPFAPPATPFAPFGARVLFDPNHGGIAQGAFHSTRVVVDTTVSLFEQGEMAVPVFLNASGLPPAGSSSASFVLRIPTHVDFGSGQFTVLQNLTGHALDVGGNAPVDLSSPTVDVLRAARAASEDEPNNGFLLDLEAPQVVGELPVQVTQAVPDPNGDAGFNNTPHCWTGPSVSGGRGVRGGAGGGGGGDLGGGWRGALGSGRGGEVAGEDCITQTLENTAKTGEGR